MKYSDVFLNFAELGAKMDTIHALHILCDAYIDMCGISCGNRTVYYRAGEGWLKKLGESDHELALDARNRLLVCMFPFINSRYTKVYDDYDISPMSDEQCREMAEELLKENGDNEELAKALCAGIVFSDESEDELSFFNAEEWFLSYVKALNGDSYKILLFRSELEEPQIKFHLFRSETLMKDFHFAIDFSCFLTEGDLKLIYQKDKEKELEKTGDACSWNGYEEIRDLLLDHPNAPVNKMYRYFENQLHEMVVNHDYCARRMHTMSVMEKIGKLGVPLLPKYEKILKDCR